VDAWIRRILLGGLTQRGDRLAKEIVLVVRASKGVIDLGVVRDLRFRCLRKLERNSQIAAFRKRLCGCHRFPVRVRNVARSEKRPAVKEMGIGRLWSSLGYFGSSSMYAKDLARSLDRFFDVRDSSVHVFRVRQRIPEQQKSLNVFRLSFRERCSPASWRPRTDATKATASLLAAAASVLAGERSAARTASRKAFP
jgi:hypothetical protein